MLHPSHPLGHHEEEAPGRNHHGGGVWTRRSAPDGLEHEGTANHPHRVNQIPRPRPRDPRLGDGSTRRGLHQPLLQVCCHPFLVFRLLPPTNLPCVSLGVATEKMPAATPGLSPSPPSTPPTPRTVGGPFTPASMASWSARLRTLSSPTGPVLYMVLRPGISTMRGTTFPRVRSLWYTEGSPWKRQMP